MKAVNYLLTLAGFEGINDYLGTFALFFKPLFFFSITTASVVVFIETYSGISFMLWVFLALGTLFDLALGWYTNVFYLKLYFETVKFYRGVFKSFISIAFIFLTNVMKIGIYESAIEPDYLKNTIMYVSATIHYSITFIIGLYLLLGIAENGAKMKIRFCESIIKIVRMQIKDTENMNKQ